MKKIVSHRTATVASFFGVGMCALLYVGTQVSATVYLSYVRDLLSTSAPSASAAQTITFRTNQAIPAGGRIVLDFTGGGFTVPASGFNYADIDLSFRSTSTVSFTSRPLSATRNAATDGVSVTTGTNGMIRFDLNTSVGIGAGYEVEVRIGTTAVGSGNSNMVLTHATGSYPVTITTYTANGAAEIDYGRTMIAVVSQVTAGPADTTDQEAPIILESMPSGLLQAGTQGVQMFVRTNEQAICRYATSSVDYLDMPYSFVSTTTTGYSAWHFAIETGLENALTYTFFVRCRDYRMNIIDPAYELTFTIGIPPGSATTTSTSTGTAVGTGIASTTASSTCVGVDCIGTGSGSGTGASGSGSGSSASGGDGSGSGSGGGGGSSSDVGTKLPQAGVRVTGWGYPNGVVSIVRDGTLARDINAGSDGSFNYTSEQMDRGSYTYAVSGTDSTGVRGASYTTTLWIRSDTVTTLANVLLPPTVTVANRSIEPGSTVPVSGFSVPRANISVWLRPRLAQVSVGDILATTTAATNGAWTLTLPSTGLSQGTYELVAQAKMESGIESDKSARLTIGIGVEVADTGCIGKGDLDCDGFVNLVDFSILLFNWNTASTAADINGDGLVSLPDFSIMLYHWTG